ncbi:MAG: hypothetical protein CM1200mP16_08640 [Nitrospina sp.]|nr:MAG: hypothetical protein CM1200mP16_08640 [Nitrospina sp.]
MRYQSAMTLETFKENPASHIGRLEQQTLNALTRSRRINLGGTLKLGEH